MRECVEVRRVDREVGVEEVGKADAERLGDEPEEVPIRVSDSEVSTRSIQRSPELKCLL